jgi:hypothetical protein
MDKTKTKTAHGKAGSQGNSNEPIFSIQPYPVSQSFYLIRFHMADDCAARRSPTNQLIPNLRSPAVD